MRKLEESLSRLVNQQADTIKFLQRRVERLEREVTLLRKALLKDLEEQTVNYREIQDRLDRLEKPILKVVLDLCRRLGRPVTYDEIIRACRVSRLFFLRDVKTETITRRVRRLKEKGLLRSPARGYFYPNINP